MLISEDGLVSCCQDQTTQWDCIFYTGLGSNVRAVCTTTQHSARHLCTERT